MLLVSELTAQFIRERVYIKAVTKDTVRWYRDAFRSFAAVLESPSKAAILNEIAKQREAGLKESSINCRLRGLNAYFRWLHSEGHSTSLLRIPLLKQPKVIVPVWTTGHIRLLVHHTAETFAKMRVKTAALLVLDTGIRVDELLHLLWSDVDLSALLVTIRCGKGKKSRIVPITAELRSALVKFQHKFPRDGYVFGTADGRVSSQRNMLRDLVKVCTAAGIKNTRLSWHTLRHTFGLSYIRAGGDVFRLQRVLGHSDLAMTRRYVNLQTEDLSAVHQRFSPLGNLR